MNQIKNPAANKVVRYLGPIIGLAVAAVILWQEFGPQPLPDCDTSEVRTALQEMLDNTAPPPTAATTIEQVSQTSFDEAKDTRTCAAVAKFAAGEEKLDYRLVRADGKSQVFLLSLPRCARNDVQAHVKELIGELEQGAEAPRTLAAVEAIEESGLNDEMRRCAALAKFEGGTEQSLAYTIKWDDPDAMQTYVEVRYQP
jgi:hypothetical protein